MAQREKRKYTMEITFVTLFVLIAVAIFVPKLIGQSNDNEDSPSVTQQADLDVPIEPSDPVIGGENAPVTIVEFMDYQCPTCKQTAAILLPKIEEYVEKGDVRYAIKDFPLNMHPNALPAAIAARAAGEQDQYMAMHDALFAQQDRWSELPEDKLTEHFVSLAEEIGLDLDQFREDLENDQLQEQVMNARDLGNRLGVNSTPTFIINGTLYDRVIQPDELDQIIQKAKES